MPPSDPYSAVKREFNEVYGDFLIQARNWRFIALAAMVVAVVAVTGLAVRATQSRFIPYIVEVDKFGSARAAGLADHAKIDDERVLRSYLNRFIGDARMVSFDPVVGKAAVDRVFQLVANNTAAKEKMSEFMAANNPLVRGQSESVQADPSSISTLRINDKVWQISWIEITRDPQGQVRNKTTWKGTFTVALNPPTDQEQIDVNPLGLFITDFDWRQELSQ